MINEMSEHLSEVRIEQDRETPLRAEHNSAFAWRYAYFPSAESRDTGESGQDYLAFKVDHTSFAFALCDGVSQSFFGNLAARLLGDELLDWLWSGKDLHDNANATSEALLGMLHALKKPGSALVKDFSLSEDIPSMVRDVLEQQRSIGSQSTFICGRIDLPGDAYPKGRAIFAWMGDSRLRIWGAYEGEERTTELGDTFHTRERWSTRVGTIGDMPHVKVLPVQDGDLRLLTLMMAYTDGAAELDDIEESPLNANLEQILADAVASPASDDIAFLEVWVGPEDATE